MRKLPNVTLIAWSGVNVEAHKKALEYSCREIKFGAVKMIEEPSKNIDEWCYNMVYRLGEFVDTEFALLVHADGFIVHPELWRDEWLNYDYIGAPWPLPEDDYSYRTPKGELVRVGNSVGLRSKKLLDLPKKLNLEWKPYFGNYHEDGFLCVHNRDILKEHGIRFADIDVAKYFSHETPIPETEGITPFMFHRFYQPEYPKFT